MNNNSNLPPLKAAMQLFDYHRFRFVSFCVQLCVTSVIWVIRENKFGDRVGEH